MNVELVDFDAFSEVGIFIFLTIYILISFQVFNPVLDKLRTCALMIRLNQAKESSIFAAEQTFKALSYLLNIKLPNNSRPIADLVLHTLSILLSIWVEL
jgi:hypothetical protein